MTEATWPPRWGFRTLVQWLFMKISYSLKSLLSFADFSWLSADSWLHRTAVAKGWLEFQIEPSASLPACGGWLTLLTPTRIMARHFSQHSPQHAATSLEFTSPVFFFFLGAPPGSRKVTQKSSPFAFSHSAVKQGWARNGRVWQEPAQDRERSLLTTHPWQRGQCPRKVKGPLSRPEDELSCWQVKMLWNKMSYTIEIYLLTQTLDRQGRPKKVLSSERCPRPPSAQQHRLPTCCVPGSLPLSEIFATP